MGDDLLEVQYGIRGAVEDSLLRKDTIRCKDWLVLLRVGIQAQLSQAMDEIDVPIEAEACSALLFVIDKRHWELEGDCVLIYTLGVYCESAVEGAGLFARRGARKSKQMMGWVKQYHI